MLIKIIGACVVFVSCGGMGFQIAAEFIREERMLRRLINILEYMECELQYRLTPLPELCRMSAAEENGILSAVFLHLSEELENQYSPIVGQCMDVVLGRIVGLPHLTKQALHMLGQTLGRFDIQGQLTGLAGVKRECRQKLDKLYKNKVERTRRYQTIGLCAGAALIILFI